MITQNFSSHALARQQRSIMQLLMARFITGQLTEVAWNRFTSVFDSVDAGKDERLAFAAFFADAARELGSESIKMPTQDEVGELIDVARA